MLSFKAYHDSTLCKPFIYVLTHEAKKSLLAVLGVELKLGSLQTR